MTAAASVASGSFQQPQNIIVSAATTRPDTWLLAPAPPLTAVFERLPLTTMPLDRPAPRFAAPSPEQLAVGVDLVVVTGGVRLGRSQTLRKADQDDADGAAGELEVLLGADVGQPSDGNPPSMCPTIATPCVQIEA